MTTDLADDALARIARNFMASLRTGALARRALVALAALGLAAAPSLASAQNAQNSYAAYTVYTYVGGPKGMAGRIRDGGGSAVTPIRNLKTGLNADPQVEGLMSDAGKARIAVTNRVAAPGAVGPTAIYNAASASNPAPLFTRSWTNVRNMSGLVRAGKYLYALDYDNARVVEINRSNFKETGVTYTLPADLVPKGFAAYGQAIVEIDGTLFGLFTFTDSAFATYRESLLVRFTIKGGSSIKVGKQDVNKKLVKNAFALAVSGSDLYVAGIGGAQSGGAYNPASRLQKITYGAKNLKKAEVTDVLAPSAQNPYEIRDVSFKGSTAYILLGAYDAGFTLRGKLVSTKDFASLKTINDFTSGAPGYFWAAQYTAENDRIWFGRGSEILVYDASSTATPAATLALKPGSLISTGDVYDNINDFAFVGAKGSTKSIRGYRSPTQLSQSPRAQAARAIAEGRPELTADERRRVDEALSGAPAGR
ncbi:hypothetical protein [Methylopila sp. M107]|uniref:hypothetical protein n=1 Tax=Methylopila sp. M107 TaxID=1101190 RepID=UPI00037ECCBA|nr:hypothetical protein [Methylopila sp. M107]